MGLAAGISLVISGFVFALGGEGFSSYFQGQFSSNGCGNTVGSALLNSGNNACINLQHALNLSYIGLVVGFLMLVGGVMAVSVTISRRKIKRERLTSYP